MFGVRHVETSLVSELLQVTDNRHSVESLLRGVQCLPKANALLECQARIDYSANLSLSPSFGLAETTKSIYMHVLSATLWMFTDDHGVDNLIEDVIRIANRGGTTLVTQGLC